MLKKDALSLFDGNQAELARAVGLTRGRISQWPDHLEQREADLVIGAAVRLGKNVQPLLDKYLPADVGGETWPHKDRRAQA